MKTYRCGHYTDVFYDGSNFLEVRANKAELEEYGLVTTSCSRTGITQDGFFDPKRAKKPGTLVPCGTYRVDVKVITNHIGKKFNVDVDVPESGKQAVFVPVSMSYGVVLKYPVIFVEKRGEDYNNNKIHIRAFGDTADFYKKEERKLLKKERKLFLWVRGKAEEFTFLFETDEESWAFLADKWKCFFRFPCQSQDTTQPRIFDMIGLKHIGNSLLGINQKHGYTEVSEVFPYTNLYTGGKLPNGWWSEGETDNLLLLYKQKEDGRIHAALASNDEEYECFFPSFEWAFNKEKCQSFLKEGLERKTRLRSEFKVLSEINSLGLDGIKLKFPSLILTKQDSLDAGNCEPGTEEFIKKYGVGTELHVANITEEMFINKGFKKVLIKKIAAMAETEEPF